MQRYLLFLVASLALTAKAQNDSVGDAMRRRYEQFKQQAYHQYKKATKVLLFPKGTSLRDMIRSLRRFPFRTLHQELPQEVFPLKGDKAVPKRTIYEPSSDGGIVSAIKAQKAELEKLGHEVTIFCPGFRTREKNVVLVPSRKWPRINNTILARKPVKVEAYILEKFPEFQEFDIVHVQYEMSCSIAGIDLAKKFGIPLAITMHGREDRAIELNVPHPFKWLVATVLNRLHAHYLPHTIKVKKDKFQAPTRARAKMWELMVNHAEQADVVTTPSIHFAQKLEHYGVTKPIVATPGGVAEDFVRIDFDERKMTDGDVLKMIWNSRVSKEKRIMPFLKALRQLKRPYMLYVYGDGNQLKKAKEYAKRYGMKVKFFGAQPRERITVALPYDKGRGFFRCRGL